MRGEAFKFKSGTERHQRLKVGGKMSRLLLLLATFNLFYNECIGTAVPTSGDNGGVIAIGYENNTYGIIFPNVSIHLHTPNFTAQ